METTSPQSIASNVAPERALTEPVLARRVTEALQMTFDGSVTLADRRVESLPQYSAEQSEKHIVTVPIVGAALNESASYLVTLSANQAGGESLASAMFGCAKKLANKSMIEDSMCELANMVAGQVKNMIAREHQIGVPSVLSSATTLSNARVMCGVCMQIGEVNSEIEVAVAKLGVPTAAAETVSVEIEARTVLIAEDDEVTLRFLKAVVESAGMRVVAECRDGREALMEYLRCRPDIACLDINMPVLTGLQALAAIRKKFPGNIVFLVSAFATADNVREAMAQRASGIIVKPFVKARILSEFARALAQRANQAKA